MTRLLLLALLVTVACGSEETPKPKNGGGDNDTVANCSGDADCPGSVCLDSAGVCASSCNGECPTGLQCKTIDGRSSTSPTVCVPPTANQCDTCTVDSDCGPHGDLCMPMLDGNFCAMDCTATGVCDSGFVCTDLLDGTSLISRHCMPESGGCSCGPSNDGIARSCALTVDGVGTCTGREVCDASAGWGACDAKTPTQEVCDDLDNDCDGATDEDPSGAALTQPCGYGPEPRSSECTGVKECLRGDFGHCSLPEPREDELLCDGLDDDCDGETDEGLLTRPETCGSCDNDCNPPDAPPFSTVGVCDTSGAVAECGEYICQTPYFDINGAANDGCEFPDDATWTGTESILNDTWEKAVDLGDLACYDGDPGDDDYFVAACDLKLPTDSRAHTPQQPADPQVDFISFRAQDLLVCEPDTWMCAVFEEEDMASSDSVVEVCASSVRETASAAPTFPAEQCATLDLSQTNWTSIQLPNDDGGYYVVRVKNIAGSFEGQYALAAYDWSYDVDDNGPQACPLGLDVDPCDW